MRPVIEAWRKLSTEVEISPKKPLVRLSDKSGVENYFLLALLLSRHGKNKGPYKEEFSRDSTVQIADRAFLENFLKTWKLHHKLEPQQLNYANKIAKVKSVGFYHGGDELYELKGVPGMWHEQCLRAVEQASFIGARCPVARLIVH